MKRSPVVWHRYMVRAFLIIVGLLTTAAVATAGPWTYRKSKDEMSSGPITQAILRSRNQINLNPPYQGPQPGTLIVRQHPRYGLDIILTVNRGQFLCGIDDCKVMIRFDDADGRSLSVNEPQDRSSDTLFLREAEWLLEQIRAAKRLRIEAIFFHSGPKVFDFDVSGLKWDAPAAK